MELKEAIEKASAFVREALPNVGKLSTDEVEYDERKSAWRITFGYKRELPRKTKVMDPWLFGSSARHVDATRPPEYIEYENVYRVVIVPENPSKQISMKIREI